jgi:uncharacterized protein
MRCKTARFVGVPGLMLLATCLHAQQDHNTVLAEAPSSKTSDARPQPSHTKAQAAFVEADFPPITLGHYRTIHSTILGEDRRLLVRLPEDYGTSGKKYPVLFKLDGEKGSFLQAFSAGYYLFDMTEGSPDLIIVGIENTDRARDMHPDKGANRFTQFLASELLPFIDESYRTSGVRILCGQSLSSLFALFSFLKEPALFDGYILSSFGLYRHSLTELFETELKRNQARLSAPEIGTKCLFVANGNQDSYDRDGSTTRRGASFLESLKKVVPPSVQVETRIYDGEGHVPFPSFYDGLRWVYSCANGMTPPK